MASQGKAAAVAVVVVLVAMAALVVPAVEARGVSDGGLTTPFMEIFQAAACTHLGFACDGKARGKAPENLQCLRCGQYCDADEECCTGHCFINIIGFYVDCRESEYTKC